VVADNKARGLRGSAVASYQKESNPNAHAEKNGNGKYGDASVLRFLKCLTPDIHAVYIGSRATVAETFRAAGTDAIQANHRNKPKNVAKRPAKKQATIAHIAIISVRW